MFRAHDYKKSYFLDTDLDTLSVFSDLDTILDTEKSVFIKGF